MEYENNSNDIEVLKAILQATCANFNNLKLSVFNGNMDSGLGLTVFEVKRCDSTIFLPAVGGHINKDNAVKVFISEPVTSVLFSASVEENAISDPLKIMISLHSWSANLTAFGRSVQKLPKVATFLDGVWQVDPILYEMMRKLSKYGEIGVGATKLCCGITIDEYNFVVKKDVLYKASERFYAGGVRAYEAPSCEIIIDITNSTSFPGFPFHRCVHCQRWFQRHLKHKLKDTYKDPTEEVDMELEGGHKKQSPNATTKSSNNSCAKVSSSSSGVKRKCLLNIQKRRKEITKLRKKLVKFEVTLCKTQSEELSNIVNIIETDFNEELEEVLDESPKTKAQLKRLWNDDKAPRNSEMLDAAADRGYKWSILTYRLVLAVYIHSSDTYEALKSFKILSLPTESSFKPMGNISIGKEGVTEVRIKPETDTSENEETGEGVKASANNIRVIAKVTWNSKSQQIIGLCMREDYFSILDDLYDVILEK